MAESAGDDNFEHFDFPDGTIFVVDVSPEMFEQCPDGKRQGNTYFKECILGFVRILKWKLMRNRRDWMGLIFYNVTRNWNPETEHILTVQKFSQIETNMLGQLLCTIENKTEMEDYCDESLSERRDYCLENVLRQAGGCFDSMKITMPLRRVVLLTRNDDPLRENPVERAKIGLRATTNRDLNVRLEIVGLKEGWNDEFFFKNLDAPADGCQPEDSETTKLTRLENRLLFAAQTSGISEWKIRPDRQIPIRVRSFSSRMNLKKVRVDRITNEILEVIGQPGAIRQFESHSGDEESNCVRKRVRYDDGKMARTSEEQVKKILSSLETGIHLIGFEPLSVDLIRHSKPTEFVSIPQTTSTNEEKALFAALLEKCQAKNVMAICAVNHPSKRYIAKMIPCDKLHGFYLCKIPFRGQVYYDDHTDESALPVADEERVRVAKKIIKKLHIEWKASNYSSPKFHLQWAYIESLALGEKFVKPFDYTCPEEHRMTEKVRNLVEKLAEYSWGNMPVAKKKLLPRLDNRKSRRSKSLSVARLIGVAAGRGGPNKARLVHGENNNFKLAS